MTGAVVALITLGWLLILCGGFDAWLVSKRELPKALEEVETKRGTWGELEKSSAAVAKAAVIQHSMRSAIGLPVILALTGVTFQSVAAVLALGIAV